MADTKAEQAEEEGGPIKTMSEMVSLDFAIRTSPTTRRFSDLLQEEKITGHKCPSCSRVYVPPKGYCPMCVVETTQQHEVEVADRGTITSFTVITPIQYYGQEERDDYVLANILLDGASSTIGQQRIRDIAVDEVRMGMRVAAVWAAKEDRVIEGRGWGGAFATWKPTGEPDVDREHYKEHML